MKKVLLIFMLFLSLVTVFPYSNVLAENQLTEEQALDILIAQIQKDKLYDSWTTLSCLSFFTEEKTKDYFDFAIHEKHGGGCPGDPDTSPKIDWFRVNRLTEKIQWHEPTGECELLPYEAILKVRRSKQIEYTPIVVNSQDYKTYCNDRYGFCVDYPCHLKIESSPENDDGRKFYDGKGFIMIASGINNSCDSPDTLKSEEISFQKDFDRITYSTKGKNWFVLSGYKGFEVLYIKTYIGKGSINHLYIRYPSQHSVEYDNFVTNISRSFKNGDLNVGH